ncbi:hypothetical protein [Blautia sp. MSJ-19]|uniref:hypothetical protein n=1 Tax=Blautia sp. MSJ-19 TaxID=2841517 RepID=UPI001C0E9D60|nr:hypothetical protein [Blautia sp. MSJ-19]MBU5481782.1 hypothetical protein [Blautia sp. MSJ-19]
MFYDNFKAACEREGTTITTVLAEIGRASGNTGGWKVGKFPRLDIVMEIAEYLQISLDELVYGLGKAPYSNKTQNCELSSEWGDIISQIPEDRQQLCKDFLRTHMVAAPKKYADDKRA